MLIMLSGNFGRFSSEVHKIHQKIVFKKKTRLGEDKRRRGRPWQRCWCHGPLEVLPSQPRAVKCPGHGCKCVHRSCAVCTQSLSPKHCAFIQDRPPVPRTRSFHRPTAASKNNTGQPSKMFIWTSGRSSTSYRHDEKRNIYQKIRDHDLLDKRKTVTALKAGEDRAILLGLAMMVCSIMMYFLLGITLLRSYMQSVWTEEAQCSLLNASITESFNCSFSCGPDCWKISQYPCLQVYVNLTSSGQKLLLYHNEETMKINSECSYIPKCGKNYEESLSLVNIVMENFRKYQRFSCFYDPEGSQKNVILTKLYSSNVLFHSLFWPTCMMIGGVAIVAMVKLTQYLSLLCERIQRINR